jgi:hypothetical protein
LRPPLGLLGTVDAALDAVGEDLHHPSHPAALMGLVGIRRGLFPDARPYRPRSTATMQTGAAA